jgi:hypothetical protein
MHPEKCELYTKNLHRHINETIQILYNTDLSPKYIGPVDYLTRILRAWEPRRTI